MKNLKLNELYSTKKVSLCHILLVLNGFGKYLIVVAASKLEFEAGRVGVRVAIPVGDKMPA